MKTKKCEVNGSEDLTRSKSFGEIAIMKKEKKVIRNGI